MFGNKKDTAPDEHLTFMSADDAAELRKRLAKEFAAQGTPVEIHLDHVAAANGKQYGLWNVAAMCHGAPRGRKHWDAIVTQHVHALLNPPPDPSTLSDEELQRIVYARVYDAESIATLDEAIRGSAREVAPGIVSLLAADFPETVVTLSSEDIARRGGDALWEAGLANTRRVSFDATASLAVHKSAAVTIVMGDSFFVASRILDMPGLLAEVFGSREYPHGVLVGVPNRHQLRLLPLDTADAVVAIGAVAKLTAGNYADSPGGVSPLVYWWGGDGFQVVSSIDERGGIAILGEGPFMDAVNALVGEGE